MAIGTYAELQTAVANWLDRGDLTERIKEFIGLAEARMNRVLRLQLMVNVDTTTLGGANKLVAGTRDYALPSGYLQMIDFSLTTDPITPLSYITPENMNRMWAGSQLGIPAAYTIYSDNSSGTPTPTVKLGPSPAGAYTYSMMFYKKIESLGTGNTTEAMLTDNPDIYLYGALMEAEPFLMNDQRTQLWATAFFKALEDVNSRDAKDRFSGSELRIVNTTGYP